MTIAVVLADDHKVFRDNIRDLLHETDDIRVVGMAEDGNQAVEIVRALTPAVVIMDVAMPHLNGIDATRRIVAELPNVKVIALSVYADKRLIARMLDAGASEYVLKDFAFEQLAGAVRAAAANDA
ncbi:MAG: response regulator [Planctomycetota bacterium]|jgi:DNA-binding NarL/FixJ family response regulator